jgi:hypothetical protein
VPISPAEKSLRGKLAAHTSWANTADRPSRTRNAREAFENKFLAEAGGDLKRAESARKAYFAGLALKSARARQRRQAVAKP